MTNINKQYLAKEVPLKETVFGHELQDNYRYFEDVKNPDFLDWVQKQSKTTRIFLDEDNLSEKIYDDFNEIDKTLEFTHFRVYNMKTHIYYLKRHFDEKKGKLYRTNYTTKKEEFLFDFDSLNTEYKGQVELQTYSVSPNEKFVSFTIGVDGSESGYTLFINLENLEIEKDVIDKTRSFAALWIDDESFFYIKFPYIEATDGSGFKKIEVKFHTLGNDFSEDVVICSENTNPEIDNLGETNWFIPFYDKKNNRLFMHHTKETEQIESLYVTSFDYKNIAKKIVFEKIYDFKEELKSSMIFGENIYYLCSKFSKGFEFRTTLISDFDNKNSQLIPIPKGEILDEGIYRDKHALYCITLKNTHNKLYKFDFKTNKLISIATESLGTIFLPWNESEEQSLFGLSNFKMQNKYYFIDKKNEAIEHEFVNFKSKLDLREIVVKTEEYISHDGVKVPISFAYKKGLERNGKNRCLIHAYGSYGMNYLPHYSRQSYRWMRDGGIIAHAHVRGGGEYGKAWHLAGKKENKANTWRDLIFAGKYLSKEKYTSKEYLACEGTSAGGITVGMTANESEDVFGAILSNVGSNNTTREGRNPGGGLSEFGNPKKQEDFDALLKMDVYQNVKEGKAYTNILFTGGMKDDRVDFWQPAKSAAKMQKCTSSTDRIAYVAYENLGHGGMGSSREEFLRYLADQYAFLDKILKK